MMYNSLLCLSKTDYIKDVCFIELGKWQIEIKLYYQIADKLT